MSSRQYLIADPDEGQRQLLDLLLADGSSVLVAVESARQVLEFLRSNTPSLVVLSQELPDMPGTAVCKRIKAVQRLSHVPVIVTTAPPEGLGVSTELRQEAGEAGVDLLLPKPLGDKALKERARRLMQEAEAAQKVPRRVGGGIHRQQGSTAVLEATLRELDEADRSRGPGEPGADEPAPDLEVLAKELAALREENQRLRDRIQRRQEAIEMLKAEVEELKKRRGLFGRRG